MTSAYPGRDPDGTPAQRAVSFDDVLVGFVCASGATRRSEMCDGWYGSNRFVCTTLKSILVKPVILPPGRAKLATKPCTTG
jgi:hypothetical protein